MCRPREEDQPRLWNKRRRWEAEGVPVSDTRRVCWLSNPSAMRQGKQMVPPRTNGPRCARKIYYTAATHTNV